MNLYLLMKGQVPIITTLTIVFSSRYGLLITLVTGAILIDIITGIIKSKIHRKVSSKIGYIGFWKKMALFAGLGFGLFLDAVVQYSVSFTTDESISLAVFQWIPFGHIIGIYIILNECISIVENLYECGMKIPGSVIHILYRSKEDIDKIEPKK